MKKIFLTIVLGFIVSGFLFAQVKPLDTQIGSQKAVSSRGADVNIIGDKVANKANPANLAVQPPNKGAVASRGSYCYITFDNWTNYYIDCYVNGYNQGYVAPYGKGEVTVTGGDTKVYGVANFDDGSKLTWGPETKSCVNQEWECTLN